MIIIIIYYEEGIPYIDHGICTVTGKTVILPNEKLHQSTLVKWSNSYNEWVLK